MGKILTISVILLLTASCGNSEKEQAEHMLQEAQALFEKGRLDEARYYIDSLRKTYPNIVEARKGILELHQKIELKAAQEELVRTDSLLKIANQKLDSMQAIIESDKAALKATPEELTLLTRTRIWRDSIRTQFETLGAKIHYIHQKQKETKGGK